MPGIHVVAISDGMGETVYQEVDFALTEYHLKRGKNKNFAHFSFQIFAVCVIFAVMIGALSSVSKALSNDDRGILASNVDFVADLQDNTNIYDENIFNYRFLGIFR